VSLPDKANKGSLTLFFEIDDVFFHTYIYDENFGFMADPAPRDPDHKVLFGDR